MLRVFLKMSGICQENFFSLTFSVVIFFRALDFIGNLNLFRSRQTFNSPKNCQIDLKTIVLIWQFLFWKPWLFFRMNDCSCKYLCYSHSNQKLLRTWTMLQCGEKKIIPWKSTYMSMYVALIRVFGVRVSKSIKIFLPSLFVFASPFFFFWIIFWSPMIVRMRAIIARMKIKSNPR